MDFIFNDIIDEKLADNSVFFKTLIKEIRVRIYFSTVLEKSYWEKHGLILVINHRGIVFNRLPYNSVEKAQYISKAEIKQLFNPVQIIDALFKKYPDAVSQFIKTEIGVSISSISFTTSPLFQPENLIEAQKNILAKLMHGKSKSLINNFIAPFSVALKALLPRPELESKVRFKLRIIYDDFVDQYNVFQLLCLLEISSIIKDENYKKRALLLHQQFKELQIFLKKKLSETIIYDMLKCIENVHENFKFLNNYEPKPN